MARLRRGQWLGWATAVALLGALGWIYSPAEGSIRSSVGDSRLYREALEAAVGEMEAAPADPKEGAQRDAVGVTALALDTMYATNTCSANKNCVPTVAPYQTCDNAATCTGGGATCSFTCNNNGNTCQGANQQTCGSGITCDGASRTCVSGASCAPLGNATCQVGNTCGAAATCANAPNQATCDASRTCNGRATCGSAATCSNFTCGATCQGAITCDGQSQSCAGNQTCTNTLTCAGARRATCDQFFTCNAAPTCSGGGGTCTDTGTCMGRSTCLPAAAPTCDGSQSCDGTATCAQPTCNATAPTCTAAGTCNGSGTPSCVSSTNTCQSSSGYTCTNNSTCGGSGVATCIGTATCDNQASCIYTSTCRGQSANTCTNPGQQAVACRVQGDSESARGAGSGIPGGLATRPASASAGELVELLQAMHCDAHWSHRGPVALGPAADAGPPHGGAPGGPTPHAHHGH